MNEGVSQSKIDNAIDVLNNLNYTERLYVYQKKFGLGIFGSDELNEKLVLISLIALITKKLREKKNDPNIPPLTVLQQLTGQRKDNSAFYNYLESLSIVVDDITYGCTKIDSCGVKTTPEILTKIKNILSAWLPF